jgi:Na+/phosphate symporter
MFYFIFALCTWSFLKPLKYIGSSNISIGIMFMSVKLINPIINALNINKVIKDILPTIINPLFISGIICLGSGILFITIFYIINGILKKKEKQEEPATVVNQKAEEVKEKVDL